MSKLRLLCLGLSYFAIFVQHAARAEEPGRLIYESDSTIKHDFDTKFFGNALLPLDSVQELYDIRYRLRIDADEQNSKAESGPKQFHRKLNGRRLAKELRERREQDLAQLLEHQAAVRELEAIGYELKYEPSEVKPTRENVTFNTPAAAYIRNSLAEQLVIPVVEIQHAVNPFPLRNGWTSAAPPGKQHELTVEMLLPFTNLREIDLSHSKFSLKEIEELKCFSSLEVIFLPENLLEPEPLKKIQAILPRSKLMSEDFASGVFTLNFTR